MAKPYIELPFEPALGALLSHELRGCFGDAERSAIAIEALARGLGAVVAILSNGDPALRNALLDPALDRVREAAAEGK